MQNLLKALHGALAEISNPVKGSSNPAFKGSKYADINAVLDAIEEPIRRHGLVVVQGYIAHFDHSLLYTRLYHVESGEMMESTVRLNPAQDTPQGIGAATTYYRRYMLSAMFTLGAQDDDGNEASGQGSSKGADVRDAAVERVIELLGKAKSTQEVDRIMKVSLTMPENKQAAIKKAAADAIARVQ